MSREQVFTLEATPLKFGRGAVADAGWELERLGVRRAMLVSDAGVVAAGITDRVRERIEASGIATEVWDSARVEPTAASLAQAAAFAADGGFDGFVAIGGGSSIDTAKVADLLATHGGEVMDYVNAPVGAGRRPPAPLMPLLVVASCGLDVICHAAESLVAKPFSERERPASPGERPPYQGATPISDVWSAKALEYGGRYLRDAVAGDGEARGWMMLAASLASLSGARRAR